MGRVGMIVEIVVSMIRFMPQQDIDIAYLLQSRGRQDLSQRNLVPMRLAPLHSLVCGALSSNVEGTAKPLQVVTLRGREGGRKGGKERGRDGGREGRREGREEEREGKQ